MATRSVMPSVTATASMTPLVCAPGSYLPLGAYACTSCPPDRVSMFQTSSTDMKAAAEACKPCGPDSAPLPGLGNCTRCPENTLATPTACGPCPASSYCAGGAAAAVACPHPEACLGFACNAALGYKIGSPLCAECADGFFKTTGGCNQCSGNTWIFFPAVVFVLVALGATAYSFRERLAAWAALYGGEMRKHRLELVLLGDQVKRLTLLNRLTTVAQPPIFKQMLGFVGIIAGLNPASSGIECQSKGWNFGSSFGVTTGGVLLVILLVAAYDARDTKRCRCARQCRGGGAAGRTGAEGSAGAGGAGAGGAGADGAGGLIAGGAAADGASAGGPAAGGAAAGGVGPGGAAPLRKWRHMRLWGALEAALPYAVQASVQALSYVEVSGKKLLFAELTTEWDASPHIFVVAASLVTCSFYVLFLLIRYSCLCVGCNPDADVIDPARGTRRDPQFNFNSRRAVVDVLGPVAIWLQTFRQPVLAAGYLVALSALDASFVTCVAAEDRARKADAGAAAEPAPRGPCGGVTRLVARLGFSFLLCATGVVTVVTQVVGLYCTATSGCSGGAVSTVLTVVLVLFNVALFVVLGAGPFRVAWAAVNSPPVVAPTPPPPAQPEPPAKVAPVGDAFSVENPLQRDAHPARRFGAPKAPRAVGGIAGGIVGGGAGDGALAVAVGAAGGVKASVVASAGGAGGGAAGGAAPLAVRALRARAPTPELALPPAHPEPAARLPAELSDEAGRPLAPHWTRTVDAFGETLYAHDLSPAATREPPLVRSDVRGRALAPGWYADITEAGEVFYARDDDPTVATWAAPLAE